MAQVWFAGFERGLTAVGWPSGCPLARVEVDEPERGLVEVAFEDGVIWVVNPGGMVAGIDPSSGERLVESTFGPDPDAGYPSIAGVPNGLVHVVAGGVQRIDATGATSAVVELPGGSPAELRSVGALVFATTDAGVVQLDGESLTPTRHFRTAGGPRLWQPIDDDTIVAVIGSELEVIADDGTIESRTTLRDEFPNIYELAVADGRAIVSTASGLASHDLDDVTDAVELAEAGGSRPKIATTIGPDLWVLDEDGPELTEIDPVTGQQGASIDLPRRSDDPQMTVSPVTDGLALVSDFETEDIYAIDTDQARAYLVGSAPLDHPFAVVPTPASCT